MPRQVAVQPLGNRLDPRARDVLLEDAKNDGRRYRVGLEAVQALARRSLRRARVQAGVREAVAVPWSTAES